MGQLSEGLALCRESVQRSSDMGDLFTIGLGEFYGGIILAMKGDGEPAVAYLEQSIAHLEKARFIQPLATSWAWLGFAHTLLGDPSRGMECIHRGLDIRGEAGVTWQFSALLSILAWCQARSGDAEGARTTIEKALASARENHEKYNEGKALLLMGKILTGPPLLDGVAAEEAINEAIKIMGPMSARTDLSTGQLFLGELYAEMGRMDAAGEHLKSASAMFKDMGMDYWRDMAERKLRDLT
jgi:tetratricopeptide (TPR) repeat protein